MNTQVHCGKRCGYYSKGTFLKAKCVCVGHTTLKPQSH